MTERANRKDLFIATATDLFMQQGYQATSVRQIADAAGVTEAALYYHFKDGKRGLLEAVVHSNMPDLLRVLEQCQSAKSLHDMICCFGGKMAEIAPTHVRRMRWFISEFQNLTPEERAAFQHKVSEFHRQLAQVFEGYDRAPKEACNLAWLMTCATFGYGQLFVSLEVNTIADFSLADMAELLADVLG